MADEPTGTTQPASGTTANLAADGAAEPGSGGAGVAETPEQKRIAELEAIHKQDLARLTAGEEASRRAEALEVELERMRQGGGHTPPTASNPAAEQLQRDYEAAKSGDPDAILRVIGTVGQVTQQEVFELRRENAYAREMDAVPSDMRDEVKKRCKAIPGLSPSWAQKDIESEMWRKERDSLADRERKLREEEERRRAGIVATTASPSRPAPATHETMKASDYARKQYELQADGKMEEALALKRRRESGEVKIAD